MYTSFFIHFLIDSISVILLSYLLFYKRHLDKESFIFYAMFNIFVFIVVSVLFFSGEDMSLGFGFGLFAILSIVTLRSEQLTKREISYFFGTLSLALINAIGVQNLEFLILCNGIIVSAAFLIDHPSIIPGMFKMNVSLDYIPEEILKDTQKMQEILSEKFHVEVISYKVSSIDYIRDMTEIKMFYRNTLS